jgi:phenylalanyl-tRNA synthetase beta chain
VKIIINDLLQRLDDISNINDLSDKLIQLGHEHEVDNNIINLELTPNRGDCFSLIGILRDLNALTKTNTNLDIYKEEFERLELNFINKEQDACPSISFLEIEVNSIPNIYEDYIEKYFIDLSNKKINFFTDISNYLSYEIGQPTHCYDRDKIDNEIILCKANENSKFLTLTDKEITLEDEDVIFISNKKIVNLAGVMGGKYSSCSLSTKKILLECAYFDPKYLTGKNIKYDLNSDAAHKFERGVDYSAQEFAVRRFIKIIEDHTEINSIKYVEFNSKKLIQNEVIRDVNKINKILGINISEDQYDKYLNSVGFEASKEKFLCPTYRHDVKHENDLAEEVARIIGYDNIERSPTNIINKKNIRINNEDIIRKYLTDKGFYEVINFPFVSENDKNSILIDNPLDSNKKYVRTNLQDCLENNLTFNERRQKDSIKLFEISDTYSFKNSLIKEKKVGIIASGRIGNNYKDFAKKIDKNYFDEVLSFFRFDDANEVVHSTEIKRDSIDSKSTDKIFYAEFVANDFMNRKVNYEQKNKIAHEFIKYEKISEYPSIIRDLSFALDDPSKYYELQELLLNYENKYLMKIFIFDFFYNQKQSQLKIGFRLIFQSIEKTLSDKDIEGVINDIINKSLKIETTTLPGLK